MENADNKDTTAVYIFAVVSNIFVRLCIGVRTASCFDHTVESYATFAAIIDVLELWDVRTYILWVMSGHFPTGCATLCVLEAPTP